MDDRVRAYAELLVGRCIDAQPGWQVLVTGTPAARPLLECLSESLARRGAFAIHRISFDTALGIDAAWVREAPPELAGTLAPLEGDLLERVDAKIFVLAPEAPHPLAGLRAEAQIALQAHVASIRPRERLFAMPNVLCCYPSAGLAAEAGLELEELADVVYGACLRDWDAEAGLLQRVAARLDAAERVVVRSPGTELSFDVGGRRALVDDGHVNMPGGEVFLSPREDSVEGVIDFGTLPQVTAAGTVVGARLVFAGGVVVESSAESGADVLAARIGRDEGSRRVGELGIGCNRGIVRPLGNPLFDEKIAGTVHVALGQGFPESGGTNRSAVHWDLVKDLRRGGEVLVDGEPLERGGEWLV